MINFEDLKFEDLKEVEIPIGFRNSRFSVISGLEIYKKEIEKAEQIRQKYLIVKIKKYKSIKIHKNDKNCKKLRGKVTNFKSKNWLLFSSLLKKYQLFLYK